MKYKLLLPLVAVIALLLTLFLQFALSKTIFSNPERLAWSSCVSRVEKYRSDHLYTAEPISNEKIKEMTKACGPVPLTIYDSMLEAIEKFHQIIYDPPLQHPTLGLGWVLGLFVILMSSFAVGGALDHFKHK